MRLGAEVINFLRLQLVKQLHHLHGIGQVAIVEVQLDPVDMRIAIKMVDAARIESRSAANDAMHFVTFVEQQLGEIRTVLARDAGDEGFFHEEEFDARTYRPTSKLRGRNWLRSENRPVAVSWNVENAEALWRVSRLVLIPLSLFVIFPGPLRRI